MKTITRRLRRRGQRISQQESQRAAIRLIVWDPPMTHYGQIERPKQLAAADFSVVRWLLK
jgi:hypothetical protein